MDYRWSESPLDTMPKTRIFFHPTASIEDVQNGVPKDSVDISPWVSDAKQTSSELNVTLNWNNEFLGSSQPRPGQVLSVMQDGLNLCIMIIDSLSSYVLSFGERSMSITARSRETQDIWKLTKLVTQLYPFGTNVSDIIKDIAVQAGLSDQDWIIPPSAITTCTTSTQMANQSAWQMMQTLFLPIGQTPYVNAIGQLKGVSRDLIGREPDVVLTNDRLLRVNASRSKAPTTRYILQWLDPNLTMVEQQGRMLAECNLTAGFFTPVFWKHLTFSEDGTQRATQTYLRIQTSVNQFRIGGTDFLPCFLEEYSQDTDVNCRIMIITLGWTYVVLAAAIIAKLIASAIPDGVIVGGLFVSGGTTIPIGRIIEAICDVAIFIIQAAMGTGDYQVWGVPFAYLHARNSSEAYDMDAIAWADNPTTVENDFIMNEAHAQAVCTRELIYLSRAASSWSMDLVEDRRIEKGDLIELPDGSAVYVTDFSRVLMGSRENKLTIQGFLAYEDAVTDG